jgi:hypothetical protein
MPPISQKPALRLILPIILSLSPFTEMKANDLLLHSVTVGTPLPVPDNTGDTWMLAWTSTGDLYTPSNDSKGFHLAGNGNVMFHRILGDDAGHLTGETVNTMSDYRKMCEEGSDGCTWKTSGCAAIDGNLYLVVARHRYGEKSGDPTKRQPARNASIIRSANGGKTWVPSAQESEDHPMFPGSHFATPYFINYGQDGHEAVADGSDRYVYALSNNGFWDNGDSMILGRVLRSNLPRLDAKDWQFLREGDGAIDANWTSNPAAAKPVLVSPNHLGMTGAVYLPAQKCYFMVGWYYPQGGGKMPDAHTTTNWDFHVAPHPWGPWQTIGSHAFSPQGFYCPEVCPKFTSADGSSIKVFTAGDWTNADAYRLTVVPLGLH